MTLAFVSLACFASGCGEPSPGQYHETCSVPFINEDFLVGDLDIEWEGRTAGAGSHLVSVEGEGEDRIGWLTIDAQSGDMSASDRSAYGVMHVGPNEPFHLRATLTSPPSGAGQVAGLLAEESGGESVVAVGLRGQGGGHAAEMLGVSGGSVVLEESAADRGGDSVLVELMSNNDEWIGRVDGEEIGTVTVPFDGATFDVGLYLGSAEGSAASLRVEWIDACRYYPGRDQ